MKLTPGISFAIPIDHAKEFLQKTAEDGKKRKPWKNRRYIFCSILNIFLIQSDFKKGYNIINA